MNTRCALFGHPVTHSRSPQIYRAFAEQTRRACHFELVDCAPADFPAALAKFAATAGAAGANVTTPLKRDAFARCNATSARAQRAGAVNLLRFDAQGLILGDNTDGAGLIRDLQRNLGIAVSGMRVLVIGAGGAACGILGPLADCHPAALVVANRDDAKALALAARFAAQGVRAAPLARPGRGYDLVINATSASLDNAVPEIPALVLGSGCFAYDLAYADDGQTAFTRWATQQGSASVHDGWGMLVEQAAESFDAWFGVRPATAPLRQAAFRSGVVGHRDRD